MQNQENAHSDATEKSLKMNSEFRFRISAKFSLGPVSKTTICINNTDFGLNDFLKITNIFGFKNKSRLNP
jgi:hypothetical protein